MRLMRPARALVAALVALALSAPAASARDAVVTSFDGTKILTHFFAADGLKPGQKAPTVLVGHGWGQSGDSNPQSSSEELFGKVGLGPLRRAGFNVLTWDARGFGQSGGQAMVDSPDFEGRDVQALISHVARQPEAQLDGRNDPRLGMSGTSYGGAIQLVTAAIDKRVDAIAPAIAWNSLVNSLYKDGVVKQGWGSILFGAGGSAFAGGAAGALGPGGVQTGGTDPAIQKAFTEGATTGRFSPESVEFFRSRGLSALVNRIRIPTLLLQGTVDTLFTLQEATASHAILKANGVPTRMQWFCGGHGACLTNRGQAGLVEDAVISWLRRHLRRDARLRTPPPFSMIDQDGTLRRGATFPPVQRGELRAQGSGALPVSPGAGNGTLIAASPSADAFNLDIPPPGGAADLAGAPLLKLGYTGTGAPEGTHVYGQIVDTGRNLVVGNVATPIPVTLDGGPHTIERPLEPIAYHAGPGSRLRLQLAPATSLYAEQRSAGALTLSSVDIRLPVVDLRASGRERLSVGPTRGVRRARKGRRFKVRVRARGAGLRGVRVVLRNRRGKRVGRSAVVNLRAGKTRKVRVRVGRRLQRGRYRLRGSGVTAEGRRLTGGRRLRVTRR
jgi:ABC-2 type transport system ATP-binding protein